MALTGGVKLDSNLIQIASPPRSGIRLNAEVKTEFKYTTFDRNKFFTVGDNDEQKEYVSRRREIKTSIKWGQFKLLVSEVQFLTWYWNPDAVPRPILLYVGAATGTHIDVLCKMFPWFEYHLYDPRDFDPILKNNPKITLYKKFFEPADAARWANRKDVYFTCDIRSITYLRTEGLSIDEQKNNEALVWQDMVRQAEWCRIIRPVKAHLKFRLPYSMDFILATGPTRTYLDGLLLRQAWSPLTSTEVRLVVNDDLSPREWNYTVHERMMFYHNTQIREGMKFLNPITNTKAPIAPRLGLLNDYDSTMTTVIVMDYLTKFNIKASSDNVTAVLKSMIMGANKGATTLLGLRVDDRKFTLDDDD